MFLILSFTWKTHFKSNHATRLEAEESKFMMSWSPFYNMSMIFRNIKLRVVQYLKPSKNRSLIIQMTTLKRRGPGQAENCFNSALHWKTADNTQPKVWHTAVVSCDLFQKPKMLRLWQLLCSILWRRLWFIEFGRFCTLDKPFNSSNKSQKEQINIWVVNGGSVSWSKYEFLQQNGS